MVKSFLKKYFETLAYFYQYLGWRLPVTILLSISVGLLDGFGLAMFIPLLKQVTGDSGASSGDELGGLQFIIDSIEGIGIPMNLTNVLMIIIVFFSLKGIAQFVKLYFGVLIRLHFIRKLRFSNINFFQSYRYKQFVQSDAGRIQNTLTGEVARVSQANAAYFKTIHSWIMMMVYVALAFVTNWQFAILVGIGGYVSNLLYKLIYKRTKSESLNISRGGHEYQRLLIQMVAFFKYMKATGFLRKYGKKLKKSVLYIEESNRKIGLYNAILTSSREPLIMSVVVLVILIQVNFLSQSMGGIILSLLFFYRSLNYVLGLQTNYNSFLSVSGSLVNMKEFMKELGDNQELYGEKKVDGFNDEIEVKDIEFYYGETQVLDELSFVFKKNSSIAFIGESGSGKTTLINLLSGLMPVDGGSISIDGVNYSDIDVRTLQEKIGYITQDPVVFSDTIFNNITKWAEPTEENIAHFWNTLEQAAIADFVRSLPKKEQSHLGNNGIQISGGQKQRMSIARELYKKPQILIMDEATSALDTETEKAIQENIDALKGKYTIIIVAHRLSTIKSVDCIYLLQNGSMVDYGPYSKLIQTSPLFKRMIELQEI